ncbi:MAG TPA: prolyl oligopeptidase family serine peptidase [Blastocatellia bacterium]|nr:prolyl oligopeptidase family serine peptidase [Blastocatellia bacterium]
MKKTLVAILVVAFAALSQPIARAQQVPFLSELFSRFEEFNRVYTEKRAAGENVSAIELLRKRAEEAFKRGNIPGILEVIGEAQALGAGKKWDERQKFIASLTVETDRLVVEPNQVLQVSLTRMFPSKIEKAFATPPTVTFAIISGEVVSNPGEAPSVLALWRNRPGALPAGVQEPVIIAERLGIAETSSYAARKLLLPDGAYQVIALIEAGGREIAEIKRQVYAISDFSDSISQMSRTIASIKRSTAPKVKAIAPLVATPEFRLQRLAQLNRTRGEVDVDPGQEIDRGEAELSALAKGENPFARERGEIERAYQASDGKFFPYRLYVPRSYDGSSPTPLIVMLHGALGDERYYFSGLFDPAVIKTEADRRGCILVGVNGRGRFGMSQEDVFEVINAVTRDYKIDASRIYLTGHSIGGFGAWLVASSKPELFAAVAPVSGGPPAQGNALTALLAKLKGTPAMVVHGAQDGIAPVQLSRTMAAAAEKAGLKVSYLEVPDGDHLSVVASTFSAIMDFFEKNVKPAAAK